MTEDNLATVLIVEDDPGVIHLQQLQLERARYRVCVATTAAEAMDFVRQRDVDLMILDQHLPGSATGLELYAQVKQAGLDIPAILVTAFPGESIVLQSFRAGVFDFVPKTTAYLDYLLPAIERVLKKRRTEYQLVESEASLASVVCSALDAILTVDDQQRIGLCNPAAEQMFAVSCAGVQGQPVQRLLPAWSGGPVAGASLQRWETTGIRTNDCYFPVELSVSWVEANRRRFWICVARDISERERDREAREQLIREHAARVSVEAIAQENARLLQELRRIDRLKDEFRAMLAHELRNPLAPIRNALHLIQRESPAPSPQVAENWAIIERQVDYLVRLVDDLLDVSRISEGKIQLNRERIDLATVVSRAIESSEPLITAKRHTLGVQVPEEPWPIDGDLVRLVQVLSNLLNNAAKYTPEGGSINLLVQREGDRVAIRVRDSGMGIPPEALPRLFELFTQSKRTLERAEGGLGIGLTLVKRLTELHGGNVEGYSAGSGKGSEFVVRLPLAGDPVPVHSASPLPSEPTLASARRVLVVDDNRDSVRTLTRLLQVLGHEVRSALSGPEALRVAAEFQPEVILLDIGLPGMDGYEVCRRLRSQPQFNQTVLATLTGYGSPEDRRQSEKAGCNAHLVKPVDLKALEQLLAHPYSLLRDERATPSTNG